MVLFTPDFKQCARPQPARAMQWSFWRRVYFVCERWAKRPEENEQFSSAHQTPLLCNVIYSAAGMILWLRACNGQCHPVRQVKDVMSLPVFHSNHKPIGTCRVCWRKCRLVVGLQYVFLSSGKRASVCPEEAFAFGVQPTIHTTCFYLDIIE